MTPDDLLSDVQHIQRCLDASQNPQALSVRRRLIDSALHVCAANLGARIDHQLASDPQWAAERWACDHETLDVAAFVLVVADAQASIDLCAAALMRWSVGPHPRDPDRDYDFQAVREARRTKSITLEPEHETWFHSVSGSQTGKGLWAYRGAALHRVIGRPAETRTPERLVTVAASTSASAPQDRRQPLVSDFSAFAEQRWRQFWRAFPCQD